MARQKTKTHSGLTVQIPIELHEVISDLCKEREISMKKLTISLLEWAGESGAEKMFRCGVRIPVWSNDSFFPSSE